MNYISGNPSLVAQGTVQNTQQQSSRENLSQLNNQDTTSKGLSSLLPDSSIPYHLSHTTTQQVRDNLSSSPNELDHDSDSTGEPDFEGSSGGDSKLVTSSKAAVPIVTSWLKENYEEANDFSLPRSTLYTHYCHFCDSLQFQAINAASFGKLIRSVFPHLKTRRLGTRGHSKYHYYGLRIKPTSNLSLEPTSSESSRIQKKRKLSDLSNYLPLPSNSDSQSSPSGSRNNLSQSSSNGSTNPAYELPEFLLPDSSLPSSISSADSNSFLMMYRSHCQQIIDCVTNQNFDDIEQKLKHFWEEMPSDIRTILNHPQICECIREKDGVVYSLMESILIPSFMESVGTGLPNMLREFGKQFEEWLGEAVKGHSIELVDRKMSAVRIFVQNLHKLASLNHLVQAARTQLLNISQRHQMIVDWEGIDFEFIQHQAAWLCPDGEEIANKVRSEFKKFLEMKNPAVTIEELISWLNDFLETYLKPSRPFSLSPQQLLLKWSFYSSLIIRDLTVRNAVSFGSFHLLRTLFDEYLSYIVEQKYYVKTNSDSPNTTGIPSNSSNNSNNNNNSNNSNGLKTGDTTGSRAGSFMMYGGQMAGGRNSFGSVFDDLNLGIARKPSFGTGSFGSFSTEFGRSGSLWRNSFDRGGSMTFDRGLFYNLGGGRSESIIGMGVPENYFGEPPVGGNTQGGNGQGKNDGNGNNNQV
eukprot:TRINITY_DN5783_c0_g1_i1.p1 TRINITY_DN5783_c0_g1~~TRINITY_DN5783_c0_g1_i1.p1  ORF type:complete len:694 (-),score=146.05 TRINITY_DN5783_c0_g1_i1:1058-3139(-)